MEQYIFDTARSPPILWLDWYIDFLEISKIWNALKKNPVWQNSFDSINET